MPNPPSASLTWTCPSCGRQVPRRVAECRCGHRQGQMAPPAPARVAPGRKGPPWLSIGGIAGAALAAAVVIDRLIPPRNPPQPAPSASATMTPPQATAPSAAPPRPTPQPVTAAPAPPAPAPVPALEIPLVTTPTPEPPRPEEKTGDAASGSGSRTAESSVDALRKRGEEALEQAMRRLNAKALQLAMNVQEYQAKCGGGIPSSGGCEGLFKEIERLAIEVGSGLEAAGDEARRSWVQPGTVREIRKKYGLDAAEWDQIAALVRQLPR